MIEPRSDFTDGCWRAGNLSYLLRKHGQTRFYDFVRNHVYGERSILPIIANVHRRMGKSYAGVLMCLERCLSAPGQMVKYGAGTDKDVEEIALPFLYEMLSVKPGYIRHEKTRLEHRFWNPAWGVAEIDGNWSYLHLVGMNADDSNRLRGRACDFSFLDEVREVKRLRYAFEAVLAMQFVARAHPGVVMVSTPPESMDHEFIGFIEDAEQNGRYMTLPVTENPDFSEEDRRMVIVAIRGGEASVAWQREALCELVSDPERLITPAMSDPSTRRAVCVLERERPPHFIPHTIIDGAYIRDKLAILFGYLDYRSKTLVIEDSILERELTTNEIQSAIRWTESDLGYDENPHAVRRKGDLTPQQLADLNVDFKLRIQRVENKDPQSAINALNSELEAHKIKILTQRKAGKLGGRWMREKRKTRPAEGTLVEANRALIHQLCNGIYNDRRSDYQRTEEMGHWDAGQCLAYFVRVAPYRESPTRNDAVYPGDWHVGASARGDIPGMSSGMKKLAESLSAPLSHYSRN